MTNKTKKSRYYIGEAEDLAQGFQLTEARAYKIHCQLVALCELSQGKTWGEILEAALKIGNTEQERLFISHWVGFHNADNEPL